MDVSKTAQNKLYLSASAEFDVILSSCACSENTITVRVVDVSQLAREVDHASEA